MADFYGPWGNPNNTYRVWIRATSSQNKSKNQSTVTVIAYFQDRYGFGFNDGSTRIGISVAGSQRLTVTKRVQFAGSGNRSVEVARASHVLGHTSSGNRSPARCVATFAAQNTGLYSGSASGNLSIPRIPQKPNAPSGAPSVSQNLAGLVTVTSKTASGNGNSITGYQSQRRNYCNGSWSAWGSSQTANSSRKTSFNAGCHGTNYQFRTRAKTSEGWGPWSSVTTFATRPRTEPPTISEITPTTARTSFSRIGRSDGGTTWRIEIADNSAFSNSRILTTSGTLTVGDLTPGTEYWARSYGVNSAGEGQRSAAVKFTTPPGTAPEVTYITDIDGRGYEASFLLPGIAAATYVTEWEFVGPGNPPAGGASGSSSGTSPVTVSGLVPGATYRVRGYAVVGSYESPKTEWQEIVMNSPGGLSGDYFDGNTPNTDAIEYEWAGTPDLSETHMLGRGSRGWMVADPEASMVGYVITGSPLAGEDYSMRYVTLGDLPGDEVEGGTGGSENPLPTEIIDRVDYTGSVHVTPSFDATLRAKLVWLDENGVELGENVGSLVTATAGRMVRISATAQSPAGAERVNVRVTGIEEETWESGSYLDLTGAMVNVGGLINYFSGNTPDTQYDDYWWEGSPNQSTTEHIVRERGFVDPFEDPDCPLPPTPPRPPAIENPCLDDIDLWRRYWVPIQRSQVSAWIDSLPSLTIRSGAERVEQVRIRYFENPEDLPPSDFLAEDFISEQLLTSMPANAEVVIDGLSERVRGRVSGGEWFDLDHLLYGTGGVPPTFPVLGCGMSYLLAIDVPIESLAGNITVKLTMTNRLG